MGFNDHEKKTLHPPPHATISKWELFPGTVFFLSLLMYGVYNVAQVSRSFREVFSVQPLFQEGRFFTKFRDVTDSDWKKVENAYLPYYIPFLVLNAAVTWLLHSNNLLRYRPWSISIIGLATLVQICGLYNTGIILGTAFLTYVAILLIHPVIVPWLLCIITLYYGVPVYKGEGMGWVSVALSEWSFTWNLLRFISFGYEWHCSKHSNDSQMTYRLLDFFSFMFYSPTLFGAILAYPQFYSEMTLSKVSPKGTTNSKLKFSLKDFLAKLAVVSAWGFGVAITIELLYFSLLMHSIDFLSLLNGFGAASLTWLCGQFFQAKYMVIYGIPLLGAYLDGVRLPPVPWFISRIYLYSIMWKRFDAGFYEMLKRYIYLPLKGTSTYQRLFASVLVFVFIFLWHGQTKATAIWTLLNFVQVVLEICIRHLAADSTTFVGRVRSKMSPVGWRRLCALTCAMSAHLSFVAMPFSWMDLEIATYLSRWTIVNLNINYFLHLVCTYAWVQTCFSIENWESGHPL